MPVNHSLTEEKILTSKQEQLIAALVAGNSIVASAKAVGISEKTAHIWLKQSAFKKAYQEAKKTIFDESLERLKDGIDLAIDTLKRNMTEAAPYVQVQAAKIWFDAALLIHQNNDLEQRHAEILERLKEIGVKP